MTLPAVDLDDRRFQDIVDEAKRLIPVWCPEWTNHNVSDPGVALIELFAWTTDLLLYRLNQVPDRLYTKFLELVGIEPFGPGSATTELTFTLSAVEAESITVPEGTEVATASAEGDPVVFTTDADLRIAQPELVGCATAAAGGRVVDCWDDLHYPRASVPCFPALVPGDCFHLGFADSLGGLLLRLEVEASVFGLGIDPQDPPVVWEVWDGEAWVACRVVADTTGGINRDGAIDLVVPPGHEPITVGEQRCHWLRVRLLESMPGQHGYDASPAIRSVVAVTLGGTVTAHHGRKVGPEVLGRSDGRPGQSFRCAHRPVLPRRDEEHVVVITPTGDERWVEVADFSASGPDDRHFTWEDTSGEIRFAPAVRQPDGTVVQHGASPPDGATVALAGYRWGGGSAGNVGPRTLTVLRTTIPYIDAVTNVEGASGGVDGETVDEAKVRGPLSLRTADRAVTAADYERLALDASPEVARALCLPATRPGGPVRLLLVPRLDHAPGRVEPHDVVLAEEVFEEVRAHLEPRRVLGTGVEIGSPPYRGTSVVAALRARRGRNPDLVRELALDAVHRYLHPTRGGDGSGWPFGAALTAAAVAQLLTGIDGVDEVEEVLLFEADVAGRRRLGRGVEVLEPEPGGLFTGFNHRLVVR